MRGPLFQNDYRPQFSGHETFPLRYGWLKKAYDEVADTENNSENKSVFLGENAIAQFGNMVASMRHWGSAAGIFKGGVVKPENVNSTQEQSDAWLSRLLAVWVARSASRSKTVKLRDSDTVPQALYPICCVAR